nr:hypothetical protein [Mycobacterium sp. UM_NZ2]
MGRIDFNGLRAIVAKLPQPVKKPQAESLAEVYHITDMPEDDNSLCWLESRHFQVFIDNNELDDPDRCGG